MESLPVAGWAPSGADSEFTKQSVLSRMSTSIPPEERGGKEDVAEGEGELPQVPHQPQPTSQEALELEEPFAIVPSWAENARPSCACSDQSLDMGSSSNWGDYGQEGSLHLKVTLKRLIAIGHLLTAVPGGGVTRLSLKGDGTSGACRVP